MITRVPRWLRKGAYVFLERETALRRVLGYGIEHGCVYAYITSYGNKLTLYEGALTPVAARLRPILKAYERALVRMRRRSWRRAILNTLRGKELIIFIEATKGTVYGHLEYASRFLADLVVRYGTDIFPRLYVEVKTRRPHRVFGHLCYRDSVDPFIWHPVESIDRCPRCEMTQNHCICAAVKKGKRG